MALLTLCCTERVQRHFKESSQRVTRERSESNLPTEKHDLTWVLANSALKLIMALRKGQLDHDAIDQLRLLELLEPSTEKALGNWCTANPDVQKIWADFNGLMTCKY